MNIEKVNGWYIDENDNRWDVTIYSKKEAVVAAKTLTNCKNCTNCVNCFNCIYCINCINCTDCINCANCSDCKNCTGCTACTDCCYCPQSDNCLDCHHCRCCNKCAGCKYCIDCRDCTGCAKCMDCNGCVGFPVNPQRIVGPRMGSRDANPAVYWLAVGKEQCVVGCFRGTLDELEGKVKETHADNQEYLRNYLKFIKIVKLCQEAK